MGATKLGRRVAALRAARGWTQADLAARAGVERSYIALIERGYRRTPSRRVLRDIAQALRVTVDELGGAR